MCLAVENNMRIAQVAPLAESVPPQLYGGTERVVSWLTEELVRRGHQVTLFASGDSRTSAHLVSACPRAFRLDPRRPDPNALYAVQVSQVFERAAEFDIVHCHIDPLAFPFGRLVPTPLVHTLHGRLDPPHLIPVFRRFNEAALVSISDAQRLPLGDLDLNWIATVYHGLPIGNIPVGTARGGYLAFLSRMSPEKRPDLAIDIAKRVGLPLRIAAKIDAQDQAFFEREIRPLLDDPLVEFLGELSDEDKWSFLGDALCLLFPIDWPEPFGLVMIEAMACGTPVIARPCGSVPEVVDDGRTGYLGETIEELTRAVKRIDRIDRRDCRASAERRFSVARMADDYEAVYRALVGRGPSGGSLTEERDDNGAAVRPTSAELSEPGLGTVSKI
jgi:glycosyltransferase involved in cell wall biosynthesis